MGRVSRPKLGQLLAQLPRRAIFHAISRLSDHLVTQLQAFCINTSLLAIGVTIRHDRYRLNTSDFLRSLQQPSRLHTTEFDSSDSLASSQIPFSGVSKRHSPPTTAASHLLLHSSNA